jgi:LacI family transcriptional regulator
MDAKRRVAVMFEPEYVELRHRETLRGVARYAEKVGWHVAVDPYAAEGEGRGYDGIIATSRKWRGPALANSPVPVVLVRLGLVNQPQLVRVVENRYAAGRMAARHLVERGYHTFAYLGFSRQTQSAIERQKLTLELHRLGRRADSARTFVTYASSRRWWKKVMASLGKWLDRLKRPAGLLVARPDFARALADLALRRGLRIPEELGIVAADNDPVLCELPPALTSIHFDYADVGHRAAEVLDRLMRGQPPPKRAVLVEPTLVPRRSTDREAVADPLIAKALWFIDCRRTEPIRPRHVAAAVGLSPRALGERFRRARGRTVLQEIIRARVEHAKLQLEGPRVPLRAVAHESGFGSYGAMLAAFRRHVGVSPSAWRQQAEVNRRGAQDAEKHWRRPTRTKRTRYS